MTPSNSSDDPNLVAKLNSVLDAYSDKGWNYSRIRLYTCPLQSLDSPYSFWIDSLDVTDRDGRQQLKALKEEIAWGLRHSDELGIAELVSLRVNKALLEIASDKDWESSRPVVRLKKKELLQKQGITDAVWYNVQEVGGEEFQSR